MEEYICHKLIAIRVELCILNLLQPKILTISSYEERLTIIFITSGSINVQLNDRPIKIVASSILCLSMDDKIKVLEKYNVYSQSFCFHPDFLILLIFMNL